MPTTTCPSEDDLKAYAWGGLPPESEDSLADHLEACPQCKATVQMLERQGDPLLARLRVPVKPDPYQQEPECRQVVERPAEETISFGGKGAGAQVATSAPAPLPPLACPGRFREYDLLEKLGEGGMGTVYKARHRQLNKLAAIKILPPGLAQDPQRIARFKREMKAIGQLDHTHIVRALDAGEAERRHYLALEYIEGLDLSKISDRVGRLSVADACEIVRQVAVGLRAADEKGLIHRDIKPSNLMLTPDGQVKILDLGLAVFETERAPQGETTAYGQIVGTPDYIAPEQINDAHAVDARADMYSLRLHALQASHRPGPLRRAALQEHSREDDGPFPRPHAADPRAAPPGAGEAGRALGSHGGQGPRPADSHARPACGRTGGVLRGADLAGLLDLAVKQRSGERGWGGELGRGEGRPLPRPGTISPMRRGRGQMSPLARRERGGGEGQILHPPPTCYNLPRYPQEPKPVVAAVPMNKDAKTADFDPYHKWLGIPPEEQPPNHYRLLGLQVFESDPEVILGAVMRQSAHLKTYQLGQHAALTQKLLNEVSAAKVCLMDPQRKAAYDTRLRKELEAREGRPHRCPSRGQTPAGRYCFPCYPNSHRICHSGIGFTARGNSPWASRADSRGACGQNRIGRFVQRDRPRRILPARRRLVEPLPARRSKGGRRPLLARPAGKGARQIASQFLAALPIGHSSPFPHSRLACRRRGAALAGVVLFGVLFSMRTSEGTLVVEISDPEATVQVLDDQGKLLIEQKAGGEKVEISVVPGKGKLRVVKNGVELLTKEFTLLSGGRETINARLIPPVELKPQVSNLKSPIPPPAVAPFDAKKAKEHQQAPGEHLGVPDSFDNITYAQIVEVMSGNTGDTKINGSDNSDNRLQAGSIVFYRTDEGRFGKMVIIEYGYNLLIRWATYNRDATVFARGDRTRLRGTCTFDLDYGVESGRDGGKSKPDIWWEQVNKTVRYLVAKNGAILRPYVTAEERSGKALVGEKSSPNRFPI